MNSSLNNTTVPVASICTSKLSKAQRNLLHLAALEATRSQLNRKHGVVLARGQSALAAACNEPRTYLGGFSMCSIHAELAALRQLLSPSTVRALLRSCVL